MTDHEHEWVMKPQTGNFLIVAECKHCPIQMGASIAEATLNEHAKLKRVRDAAQVVDETHSDHKTLGCRQCVALHDALADTQERLTNSE